MTATEGVRFISTPTMCDRTAETAKCFVPEMLMDFIDRNMQNGKEGLEPSSFFLHGVCLLVDISGFTKLSGDFCSMGKAGIDELQLATNGYMGKLVETIYMFGGEIIKFAGDAIICVFASNFVTGLAVDKNGGTLRRSLGNFGDLLAGVNTDGQSSRTANFLSPFNSTKTALCPAGESDETVTQDVVLRAMYCASVLREIKTEKLSVHVAMSCGEMCFGILGGVENRWECLISGPCIHELSDCLDDAPSKAAVISSGCAAILLKTRDGTIIQSSDKASTSGVITTKKLASIDAAAGKYDFELEQLPSGNHMVVSVHRSKEQSAQSLESKSHGKDSVAGGDALSLPSAALIRQFVPVPIADEVEAGRGLQFIAEIREVTTMFMKVSFDSSCFL
jgi:hypothetical protein